jgi:hypothetical protein
VSVLAIVTFSDCWQQDRGAAQAANSISSHSSVMVRTALSAMSCFGEIVETFALRARVEGPNEDVATAIGTIGRLPLTLGDLFATVTSNRNTSD